VTLLNSLPRSIALLASSTFFVHFVHHNSVFAVSFGYTRGAITACCLSYCIQTLRPIAALIAEFMSDLDASIF